MEREDNFFLLLGLPFDPAENNEEIIKQAIKKQQILWSKQLTMGSKALKAKTYLEMIPEINRVMLNPSERAEEAKRAKEKSLEGEKEKNREIDEAIRVVSLKGKINYREFQKLFEHFQKKYPGLTENNIRQRITVPIESPESGPEKSARKALDEVNAKIIKNNLDILKQASLYEFLGVSKTSSQQVLADAIKSKSDQLRKSGDTGSAGSAAGVLIGQCLSVLAKGPQKREEYDETLRLSALESIKEKLEYAGLDDVIEETAYDNLVREAMNLGFSQGEACDYIDDYCRKRKWQVIRSVRLSVEDMRQCGVCGLNNPPEAKICSRCGFPLQVECPRCQNKTVSQTRVCAHCGFPIGDMPNALPLIREGRLALSRNDYNQAEELLKQADVYWPGKTDIKDALNIIQQRKTKIDALAQKIENGLQQKHYYEVNQLLSQLKSIDEDHPVLACESRVLSRVSHAEALVKSARAASDEKAAISGLMTAIEECPDCQDAQDMLKRWPPEPPLSANFSTTTRSISLKWQPSSSYGQLSYQVVRKSQSPPLNARDGEIAWNTAQTLFEDPDIEAGDICYYAVFTMRAGTPSSRGTVVGPVMRMAEVNNLKILPADGSIQLFWDVPVRARGIEVWRRDDGIAPQAGEGTRLSGVRMDGLLDSQVDNGRPYQYRIVVLYEDGHGKVIGSSGLTCQARAIAPPPPVLDLSIVPGENDFTLTWTPPKRGTVNLFYAQQKTEWPCGKTVPVNQLKELGKSIPVQSAGRVTWSVSFKGIVYIVPATLEENLATIGEARAATSLSEIKSLHGQIEAKKLYLEWVWPEEVQEVLVAYRHDAFPGSADDPGAVLTNFTRRQYDKEAAFILRQVEDKDYYFTVFTASGNVNQCMYSAGQRLLLGHQGLREICYRLKIRKGFLGRGRLAAIEVWCPQGEVHLGELVLVKKSGNLPTRRGDGEVIHVISAGTLIGKSPVTYEIPLDRLSNNSYARLFFTSDADAQVYRILSPSREALCLG